MKTIHNSRIQILQLLLTWTVIFCLLLEAIEHIIFEYFYLYFHRRNTLSPIWQYLFRFPALQQNREPPDYTLQNMSLQ